MSFLRAADAQLQAVHQAVEHMGASSSPLDQLVAHAGPAGFLAGNDLDAVLLVEALFGGDSDTGAVGQRDETDLHFGFFRRIGSSGPGAAAHAGSQQAHDGHRCGKCGALLEEVAFVMVDLRVGDDDFRIRRFHG
jgi:hypothetical protein